MRFHLDATWRRTPARRYGSLLNFHLFRAALTRSYSRTFSTGSLSGHAGCGGIVELLRKEGGGPCSRIERFSELIDRAVKVTLKSN